MFNIVQTIVKEFYFQKYIGDSEEKISSLTKEDALERLENIAEIHHHLGSFAITRSSHKVQTDAAPLRIFPCPPDICKRMDHCEYGFFLLLFGDGDVASLAWGKNKEGEEAKTDFLKMSLKTKWSDDSFQDSKIAPPFSQSQLNSSYVIWSQGRRTEAFICYGEKDGEEVSFSDIDTPPSRMRVAPTKADIPEFLEKKDFSDFFFLSLSKGRYLCCENRIDNKGTAYLWNSSKTEKYHTLTYTLEEAGKLAAASLHFQNDGMRLYGVTSNYHLLNWPIPDSNKNSIAPDSVTPPGSLKPTVPPTALAIIKMVESEQMLGLEKDAFFLAEATRMHYFYLFDLRNIREKLKRIEMRAYLPAPIRSFFPASSDLTRSLVERSDGITHALRFRSNKYIDKKIDSIVKKTNINIHDKSKPVGFETRDQLNKFTYIPFLLLKRIWEDILFLKEDKAFDIWERLLLWLEENNGTAECHKICNQIAHVIFDAVYYDSYGLMDKKSPENESLNGKKEIIKTILEKTIGAIWKFGDKKTIIIMWLHLPFLAQNESLTNLCKACPIDLHRSIVETIKKELKWLGLSIPKGVFFYPDEIRDIAVFGKNGDEVNKILVLKNKGIHLLVKKAGSEIWEETDKKRAGGKEINQIGVKGELQAIIDLDKNRWALITTTGEIVAVSVSDKEKKIEIHGEAHSLPASSGHIDLRCAILSPLGQFEGKRIIMGGSDAKGRALIVYQERQSELKDSEWKSWKSKEFGEISILVATDSHVYALDGGGQNIYRSGLFYAGFGKFEKWLSFDHTPKTMVAFQTQTSGWRIIIGDNQGRIYGIPEGKEDQKTPPVIAWKMRLPSSVESLCPLSVPNKEDINILMVGTSKNGLYRIYLDKLIIRKTLFFIYSEHLLVKSGNGRVFACTTRGELWEIEIADELLDIDKIDISVVESEKGYSRGLSLLKNIKERGYDESVKKDMENFLGEFKENASHRPVWMSAPPVCNFLSEGIISLLFSQRGNVKQDIVNDWFGKLGSLSCSLQLHATTLFLNAMSGIKGTDRRLPRIDEALSIWIEQFREKEYETNNIQVELNRRNVWSSLISGGVLICGLQRDSKCQKKLFFLLKGMDEKLNEKDKEIFYSFFQAIRYHIGKKRDIIRQMSACWSMMVRINSDNFKDSYRLWKKVFREKDILFDGNRLSIFWPENLLNLMEILYENPDNKKVPVEQFGAWLKDFKAEENNNERMKDWGQILEALGQLFPYHEMPDYKFIKEKFKYADKGKFWVKPLSEWLGKILENREEYHKIGRDGLKELNRKINDLTRLLDNAPIQQNLPHIEGRIVHFMTRAWKIYINATIDQWQSNLRELARNNPEKVIAIQLISESWSGDDGEISIALRNAWEWSLEIEFMEPRAEYENITLNPTSSFDKEKLFDIRVKRYQIKNNKLPAKLLVSFAPSRDSSPIKANIERNIEIKQSLDSWIANNNVDSEIAGLLNDAIRNKKNLLIQHREESLIGATIEALKNILMEQHGYKGSGESEPLLYFLKSDACFDLDFVPSAFKSFLWIPIELNLSQIEENELKKEIRLYFHGIDVPKFSNVAALVTLLGKENEIDGENIWWLPVMEQTKLKSGKMIWESLPKKIQNFIAGNNEQLNKDQGWLFGLDSDLALGHLAPPAIWKGWLSGTHLVTGLDIKACEAVRKKVGKLWAWDEIPPPPEKVMTILTEQVGFEGEERKDISDIGGWIVWQGKVVLALHYWVAFFIFPLESEMKNREKWDNIINIVEKSRGICFVMVKDKGKFKPPKDMEKVVFLGQDDVFQLLTWPKPARALAWHMSRSLSLTTLNPYVSRHGLSGKSVELMFYGRKKELEQCNRAPERGKNFLICGSRRIGKTSLLQKIRYEEEKKGTNVFYMDFQDLASGDGESESAIKIFINRLNQTSRKENEKSARLFFSKEKLEEWLRRLPSGKRPLFLMDEADRLFDVDHRGKGEDPSRATKYYGKRLTYPLFSWLRRITGNDHLASCIMVSYIHGSTRRFALNNFVSDQGTPLYNWLTPLKLGPWEKEEARDFLLNTFNDLGLFLEQNLLEEMLTYSLNLPWLIQDMADKLIQKMETGSVKLIRPSIRDVKDIIHQSLIEAEGSLETTVDKALDKVSWEICDDDADGRMDWRGRYRCFWPLLRNFGKSECFNGKDGELFRNDDFFDFLRNTKEAQISRIGAHDINLIMTELDRTLVFNGKGGNYYQFPFGFLPHVVRCLDTYF